MRFLNLCINAWLSTTNTPQWANAFNFSAHDETEGDFNYDWVNVILNASLIILSFKLMCKEQGSIQCF